MVEHEYAATYAYYKVPSPWLQQSSLSAAVSRRVSLPSGHVKVCVYSWASRVHSNLNEVPATRPSSSKRTSYWTRIQPQPERPSYFTSSFSSKAPPDSCRRLASAGRYKPDESAIWAARIHSSSERRVRVASWPRGLEPDSSKADVRAVSIVVHPDWHQAVLGTILNDSGAIVGGVASLVLSSALVVELLDLDRGSVAVPAATTSPDGDDPDEETDVAVPVRAGDDLPG